MASTPRGRGPDELCVMSRWLSGQARGDRSLAVSHRLGGLDLRGRKQYEEPGRSLCERSSRAWRSEYPCRTDPGSRRCARRPRDTGRLPDASACRSDRLSIQDLEPGSIAWERFPCFDVIAMREVPGRLAFECERPRVPGARGRHTLANVRGLGSDLQALGWPQTFVLVL